MVVNSANVSDSGKTDEIQPVQQKVLQLRLQPGLRQQPAHRGQIQIRLRVTSDLQLDPMGGGEFCSCQQLFPGAELHLITPLIPAMSQD